jgi:hypothetical protein
MLKFLKSLFGRSPENFSSDNSSERDDVETKKCMNCLRRVESHRHTCPYCRHSNFL